MRLASVRRFHVRLSHIADDTLFLADGRPRALFAVTTPDLLLASDDALELVTARLEGFLHGLNFPLQLVYRLVPVDLDHHAAELEALAAGRSGRLARAGRQLAAWIRHLGRTARLLEPRLYLVIGLDGPPVSLGARIARWCGCVRLPGTGRRRHRARADGPVRATDELDRRGEALAAALDRLGVGWHRLDDAEIAALFADCWRAPGDRTPRAGARATGGAA
jgi:hypothetical protein